MCFFCKANIYTNLAIYKYELSFLKVGSKEERAEETELKKKTNGEGKLQESNGSKKNQPSPSSKSGTG